jgi:hypothetical protein
MLAKLKSVARKVSGHPRLPLLLALASVILMLPALWAGLFCDDLIQRPKQFTPAELPPHMLDTGLASTDSGRFGTVLWSLFSFSRPADAAARARDYGVFPWWTPETWKAVLLRPLTAFTHWLDYRLFPDSPALMHAHSIAWYALAIFLSATLYRKIATVAAGPALAAAGARNREAFPRSTQDPPSNSGHGVATFAALLLLIDSNIYFPVMFVANRGFIISLVFGLLCLRAHLQWRIGRSKACMWLSALCLLLSILADEGGASTLAFLMAYALAFEPGGWLSRLRTLLPAAAVVMVWRVFYVGAGFGVRNFSGYIDPGYEPFLFLKNLPPRVNTLLGGQLTGLLPEFMSGLNRQWQAILALVFLGFTLACAAVFAPVLRRDRAGRFWAAVMLLALVPAATVVPLSKNMGFISLGAFGIIAPFLARFARARERAGLSAPLRILSWCVAGWLLLAHIPGALAGRVFLAQASLELPKAWDYWCGMKDSDIGNRDVVALNDPALIFVPFDRAYRGRPLPRTVRLLVPGLESFEVKRANVSTLILTAKEADLFDCPDLGPVHLGYAWKAYDDLFLGGRVFQNGDRVVRQGFIAEVLEVSPGGGPRAVAFHFDKPLESEEFVWLYFDCRRQEVLPFVPPAIGESVEIAGPRGGRAEAGSP